MDYHLKDVVIDGKPFEVVINVFNKADGSFVYEVKLQPNKKRPRNGPQLTEIVDKRRTFENESLNRGLEQSITDTQQNVKSAPQTQQGAGSRKPKQKSSYDFIRKLRLYDIVDLVPTKFTEKETVAAKTENPSPGASRNTTTIFVQSNIAQKTQNVKPKQKSSYDFIRELTEDAENLPSSLANTKNAGNRQTLGERARPSQK